MSKYCSECGTERNTEAKFCVICGKRFVGRASTSKDIQEKESKLPHLKEKVKGWKKEGYKVDELEEMIGSIDNTERETGIFVPLPKEITSTKVKKTNTGIILGVISIVVVLVIATSYVYVSGMIGPSDYEPVPSTIFMQTDTSTTNSLTLVAADPATINWADIEILVDGSASNHGMFGTITAGDIIDLSNIAGNGEYAVSIRYIPSNTLIGEYAFTGHD